MPGMQGSPRRVREKEEKEDKRDRSQKTRKQRRKRHGSGSGAGELPQPACPFPPKPVFPTPTCPNQGCHTASQRPVKASSVWIGEKLAETHPSVLG